MGPTASAIKDPFFCKDHPDRLLETFDNKTGDFNCYECSFKKQIDKSDAKILLQEDLINHFKKLMEYQKS